ncbi:protein of unknown function [Burkholderia multivorans]
MPWRPATGVFFGGFCAVFRGKALADPLLPFGQDLRNGPLEKCERTFNSLPDMLPACVFERQRDKHRYCRAAKQDAFPCRLPT